MKEATKDTIRIILAILLPPLGVFLQVGLKLHFWINIILTLLGFIPGIIHAVYIILTRGNSRISA
ncbi:MAG: YqaE/Pmp3 family membrane protein [Verrucomicrobiales bacterium]|nr:YqaE/Pmp3 family membrane protein [Verrucomicrobiales bacterium]